MLCEQTTILDCTRAMSLNLLWNLQTILESSKSIPKNELSGLVSKLAENRDQTLEYLQQLYQDANPVVVLNVRALGRF